MSVLPDQAELDRQDEEFKLEKEFKNFYNNRHYVNDVETKYFQKWVFKKLSQLTKSIKEIEEECRERYRENHYK